MGMGQCHAQPCSAALGPWCWLSLTLTLTCPGIAVPVPQVPRRLHEDIKETLQVRGAGAVLGVKLDTARGSGRARPRELPSPSPPAPGPQADLKKGLSWWTRPSLEASLALVKSGSQPGGRLPASTAKPWFCAVMKQRCESSCRHGWLCPRFPYLGGGTGVSGSPSSSQDPRGDSGPPLTSSCRYGHRAPGRAVGVPGRSQKWAWAGVHPAPGVGWTLSPGRAVGPRGHC